MSKTRNIRWVKKCSRALPLSPWLLVLGVLLPFLAKLIQDYKNHGRVGPACLKIAVWRGRGAAFRARTARDKSKEVLGMAKWSSAKEMTAQKGCQIREGEPKKKTAHLCQKKKGTARGCHVA
jgi:hypothetical protein